MKFSSGGATMYHDPIMEQKLGTIKIQQVCVEDVLSLRQNILLPHLHRNQCLFDNDQEPKNFHLLLTYSKNPAGICSVLFEPFEGLDAYRLRQMGVLPEYRRLGFGKRLIDHAEELVLAKGIRNIWFQAREVAWPFYLSCGYSFCSQTFEIDPIGPHRLMHKEF